MKSLIVFLKRVEWFPLRPPEFFPWVLVDLFTGAVAPTTCSLLLVLTT